MSVVSSPLDVSAGEALFEQSNPARPVCGGLWHAMADGAAREIDLLIATPTTNSRSTRPDPAVNAAP